MSVCADARAFWARFAGVFQGSLSKHSGQDGQALPACASGMVTRDVLESTLVAGASRLQSSRAHGLTTVDPGAWPAQVSPSPRTARWPPIEPGASQKSSPTHLGCLHSGSRAGRSLRRLPTAYERSFLERPQHGRCRAGDRAASSRLLKSDGVHIDPALLATLRSGVAADRPGRWWKVRNGCLEAVASEAKKVLAGRWYPYFARRSDAVLVASATQAPHEGLELT